MTQLDTLAEDESFVAVQKGVQKILENVDDPEALEKTLEEEGFEAVAEELGFEDNQLETNLHIIHALANEIAERNPDLVAGVEAELSGE